MTIQGIINEVQYAIDEENVSSGAHISTTLGMSMVEGVRNAACQALRWLAINAPSDLLDGSDETSDPGFIVTSNPVPTNNVITLTKDFVRLVRVRASQWHRAISDCILDTSEEYLELTDTTAIATNDRPVAALVLDNPKKLELWPYESGTVSMTVVNLPTTSLSQLANSNLSTTVPIPPKLHMAFIYYTAYLLLLSYKDNAASAYRDVAFTALGITNKK